jgi:hypothetical protein
MFYVKFHFHTSIQRIIRSGKFSMDQFSGVKDQQHYDRVFIFVFSSIYLSVHKIYPEIPGIMLAMFGKTPSPLVTNELEKDYNKKIVLPSMRKV